MSIVSWLLEHRNCRECSSAEFMYDEMDSQSGRSLPVIYREFDPGNRTHWRDEGQILDFFCSLAHESPRVLDFGPGDGWPSLRLAPMAAEVVGVDASARRIEECRTNALNLGVANARFVHSAAGAPLPFEDESFDGVVAASSIEQTPDPAATIRELRRVLKPGGRLRMSYEALGGYRGERERVGWIAFQGENRCHVDLYDRDPDCESARMVRIVVATSASLAAAALGVPSKGKFPLSSLQPRNLERLESVEAKDVRSGAIEDIRVCRLSHPSGATYLEMLRDAGFCEAAGKQNGGDIAAGVFSSPHATGRPTNHAAVRDYLLPIVDAAVQLHAPIARDPWITAVA
jgi:SAM-dependent methyltransferase